jgi:hypothetical protein
LVAKTIFHYYPKSGILVAYLKEGAITMDTTISLEELEKQIYELRKSMIDIGTIKGLAHSDTVKVSTELDIKLNIFSKMLSQ